MGTKTTARLSLYRQEKLIEKLLKFRLKGYDFDLIKVECYNRFEGDNPMCRIEVFHGGTGIKNRFMKHESVLSDSFVTDVERRLELKFNKSQER